MTAGFATNALGLRVSGRAQLALVGLLALLLAIACIAALPLARAANLQPFAPRGVPAIGQAASLLFFSFAGWEAVTHPSVKFRNPGRDLRRATAVTLAVITVLYVGLASLRRTRPDLRAGAQATTGGHAGALEPAPEQGNRKRWARGHRDRCRPALPRSHHLLPGRGQPARRGTGSRRRTALWPAKGNRPGEVPRRSLGLLGLLSLCVSIWAISTQAELRAIMLAASACFIAVTVAGLIAGIRRLPRGRPVWYAAVGAAVAMGVVLLFSGVFLAVPALLSVAALLHTTSRRLTDP
jgi:amino acid efflux transporter